MKLTRKYFPVTESITYPEYISISILSVVSGVLRDGLHVLTAINKKQNIFLCYSVCFFAFFEYIEWFSVHSDVEVNLVSFLLQEACQVQLMLLCLAFPYMSSSKIWRLSGYVQETLFGRFLGWFIFRLDQGLSCSF